jgi:uncharacterized protein (UPF0276 family)
MIPSDKHSVGVSITWSSSLDQAIFKQNGLIDWIEFEPQTTWLITEPGSPERAPYSILEHLQDLGNHFLVHSVAAPVGGSSRPSAHHLDLLRKTITALKAPWVSEHLSFNASHGVSTGFFMPPRQTSAQVQVVADNIRRLQDSLGVPVAIENGVSYLNPRTDEISDAEFIALVAEAADCGLLLDLHNAYTNAINGRQPLDEFLKGLPLNRVWEIHLAGGIRQDGFWLDAHSGAVPEELWPLISDLPTKLSNLQVVNFEVFPSFLTGYKTEEMIAELGLIRSWASGSFSGATPPRNDIQPQQLSLKYVESISPRLSRADAWEAVLTSLVTSREVILDNDDVLPLRQDLVNEAGIALVRELVFSFRASMVVQVLKLSSCLLLHTVGPGILRQMLGDAFLNNPPVLYALLEAQVFAQHVQTRGWKVPYLKELLDYELAVAKTLIDMKPRVVQFPFEPMPLLRALADERIPDQVLQEGQFEIEILPDTNLCLI